MGKKKIRIYLGNQRKTEMELETGKLLTEIRNDLLDPVKFPFIFLDDEDNEIPKEKESTTKLEDILDGRNLMLKKIEKKKMLGRKIKSKNGLDFYIYPQINLTKEEKDKSLNIMILGETGMGKSTWLHSLINYIQNIKLEENNRYLLFDEKSLQEEYQKIHGKKPYGCSVTDKPAIYSIEASKQFINPLRIIDTPGFGNTRGPIYDEKIINDIIDILCSSDIAYINAICLMFKANQNRVTDRFNMIINQIFSLFGEDIKNNIIILFSFADDFNYISALNILKDKNGIFYNLIGNDKFHYFTFNNFAYFSNNKNEIKYIYNANTKNFSNFFEYISSIKKISLESTKKVIKERMFIKNSILNLCDKINEINLYLSIIKNNQKKLLELQKELDLNHENTISKIPDLIEVSFYDKINDIIKIKRVVKYKIDENYKQTQVTEKKVKEQINNQIEVEKKDLQERINNFNHYLKEIIDLLYQIVTRNNELNLLALKKDDEKHRFIKEIFNNSFNIKKENKIFEVFFLLLDDIEKSWENNSSKEETLINIKNILLND